MMSRKCFLALLCTWLALSPVVFATKCSTTFDLTSENGVLMANGERFYLKGLNWFGFETAQNIPHGLWGQTLASLLNFVQNNGFNAIRLPFHLELFTQTKYPGSIGPNSNMQGMNSLQVMDLIISEAGKRGIVIMLDLHSFTPDNFMTENMWYTSTYPESAVLSMWATIVARYKNTWNVVAFDLKNEPYGCTWGTGNTNTDFNLAASRIGTYIQNLDGGSRFLIFVEGVASSPACADPCFWGEDLQGAYTNPVSIPNMKKLVYSPHVYGPDVSAQAYFSASNFPANMPAIWNQHFGNVPSATGNAIVIGEWGGKYISGPSATWMEALVTYLVSKGSTDTFYWCLNPNSGDTGGLLMDDWVSPSTAKLNLVARLVPNPSVITVVNGQICVSNTGSGSASVVASVAVSSAVSAVTSAVASSSGGGGGGGGAVTPPKPSTTTGQGSGATTSAVSSSSSATSANSGSVSCSGLTISTAIRSSWSDGAGTHGIYDITITNSGSSSASNVPITITVSSGATIEQTWNLASAGSNKFTTTETITAGRAYSGAGFIAGGSSPTVQLVCASSSSSSGSSSASSSAASSASASTSAKPSGATSTTGSAAQQITTSTTGSAVKQSTTSTTGTAVKQTTTTGSPASPATSASSSSSGSSSTSTSTTCRAGISFALSSSWGSGGQVSITISNTGTQPIKGLRVSVPGTDSVWNLLADTQAGYTLPSWAFPLAAGAKFTSAGYTFVGSQPAAGAVLSVSC